jgi:hypothetical protein
MMQRAIVVRKEPLMGRNADDGTAARPQDASYFSNGRKIIFYMLEDI